MIVLIDYDNLDVLMRRRGIVHVITSLLGALEARQVDGEKRIFCRLYGGWFDESSLSRNAQQLAPDLRKEFPRRYAVSKTNAGGTLLVQAELASSLACDPRGVLTHTFRRRSPQKGLKCVGLPFADCFDYRDCSLVNLEPFFQNDQCPKNKCSVVPTEVLKREEQKLVDSMIVTDLIHSANSTGEVVVVVSADDDLWPGIRYALLQGARIIHGVPRRGKSKNNHYQHLATETYSQIIL